MARTLRSLLWRLGPANVLMIYGAWQLVGAVLDGVVEIVVAALLVVISNVLAFARRIGSKVADLRAEWRAS